MANNKHNRPDHDDAPMPAPFEGLRDAEYVSMNISANDILREIRVANGTVHLVFTRTIRKHPSGEILSVENVHETHPLADISERVIHNVTVMGMAAKMRAETNITRHQFFTA